MNAARANGAGAAVERLAAHGTLIDPDPWREPLPLPTQPSERLPYPVDALPRYLADAVLEVRNYVQAPLSMIATTALASMAVAAQAHVDIARDDQLVGPVSINALIFGDSGERKTSCEGYFTGPIREYQAEQRVAAAASISKYRTNHSTYEAKRSGLLAEITRLSKAGDSTEAKERELCELDERAPVRPRVPTMLLGDATPEGLLASLAKEWPSAAILSDEGGAVFGSHAMNRDTIMRNLATLNKLWGGGTHRVVRRTSDTFDVEGVRLSVSIMVQLPVLRAFLEKNERLARGSGFLARFLVCDPESTQGQRSYRAPPVAWPRLDTFHDRMRVVLRAPVPITERGTLEPRVLELDEDARRAWVRFHDDVESGLAAGGELADVRDTASKAAENAARIAALFAVFDADPGCTHVGVEHIGSACRIAAWHLSEAQRLFGRLATDEQAHRAAALEGWLVERCRTHGVREVARREAQRLGPRPTRNLESLRVALEVLADLGRVRLVEDGQAIVVRVNPALLGEGRP